MLAEDGHGNRLLELRAVSEPRLSDLVPLTHACVVARRGEGILLVFDRWKQHWEMPGGAVEPGESPRDAAVRELREESNAWCAVEALRFLGAIVLWVGPNRHGGAWHIEYGALYAVDDPGVAPFVPTDEIAAIRWWDRREEIGTIGVFDRALLSAAAARAGRSGSGRGGADR